MQRIYQQVFLLISETSSVWQSTWFGTKGSLVRIQCFRLRRTGQPVVLLLLLGELLFILDRCTRLNKISKFEEFSILSRLFSANLFCLIFSVALKCYVLSKIWNDSVIIMLRERCGSNPQGAIMCQKGRKKLLPPFSRCSVLTCEGFLLVMCWPVQSK